MKENIFKKKIPLKTLFAVLFVSLVVIIFAEILLSIMSQEEKVNNVVRYIRLKENIRSTIQYVVPNNARIKKTDSLVQKKFRFEVDKDGYLYPSRIHTNPDMTLLFLGGSTTECMYVNEKNRFPYLVGRLLEKNGKKVNSFNSGVSGNNSMHSIDILLNKGLELRPDVAIMMHNINDLIILLYEENYWNKNQGRSLLVVQDKSMLFKGLVKALFPRLYGKYNILRIKLNPTKWGDEFANLRGKKLTVNKQEIIKKFENNLLTFIGICKANGIVPVLMTQANRFKAVPDKMIYDSLTIEKDFGITYAEYKDAYDALNDLIRKVGKSNNVFVIDLAKEIPQDKIYMFDPVHFNDYGSKYAAELIADQLSGMFSKSPGHSN